ncbi:MAG: PDZ domain-containing protein, partial [Thermoanaerobaculia bacterium]
MNRSRRLRHATVAVAFSFTGSFCASAQPPPPERPPAPTARPAAPAPAALPAPPARAPRPPRPPHEPRWSGGYLGVELVDLTPELRAHFGAPREVGVMLARVEPESPAARAGLEVGDIVVGLGTEPVHDSWGFSGEVSSRQAGEVLVMTVVRDGRERNLEATLERREREGIDVGRWIFPPTPAIPGVPP